MLQSLLNGTNALSDFQMDLNSADILAANVFGGVMPTGPTNYTSYQCVIGRISVEISQETFRQDTFCSGKWVGRSPGFQDIQATLDKFSSKGGINSDPLAAFNAGSCPIIYTAATGCTLNFMGIATRDQITSRVKNSSAGSFQVMGDGTYIQPATVWVVA